MNSPRNILIVERNPEHIRAAKYQLASIGLEATYETSFRGAVKLLQTNAFDALICDLYMNKGLVFTNPSDDEISNSFEGSIKNLGDAQNYNKDPLGFGLVQIAQNIESVDHISLITNVENDDYAIKLLHDSQSKIYDGFQLLYGDKKPFVHAIDCMIQNSLDVIIDMDFINKSYGENN